jgi:hypothetical protein
MAERSGDLSIDRGLRRALRCLIAPTIVAVVSLAPASGSSMWGTPTMPSAGVPPAIETDAERSPVQDGGVDGSPDDGATPDDDALQGRLREPLVPPLPPVAPTPELSPILDENIPRAEPAPLAPRDRPGAVVRIVIGLMLLLALAYLSGHHVVQRVEERLGVSQVITAGFPFVLLGIVARTPTIGVLTDDVLAQLNPLLRLGLGWIGFMVGFRFDSRLLERLVPRTVVIAALLTVIPFTVILGATGAMLALVERLPEDLGNPVFIRDAIILGTSGSMTAYSAMRLLGSGEGGVDRKQMAGGILRLEELAGIVGLAFIAAYFRPHAPDASWQLPGTGWLLLTLGLGMAAGLFMYLLLRIVSGRSELIAVVVGTIVFAAGFAGVIRLSPVVVCFVMGLMVTNAPGLPREELTAILVRLERPLYFVFLLIVGALWKVGEPRGWGLMLVFVLSRLAGKALSVRFARRRGEDGLSRRERRVLAVAPVGPLALAIVVNAQLLYPGGSVSKIVTAILGGAILTEILVQLSRRWWASADERAR